MAVGTDYQEIATYLTSCGADSTGDALVTGYYGAELARILNSQGFTVKEVN